MPARKKKDESEQFETAKTSDFLAKTPVSENDPPLEGAPPSALAADEFSDGIGIADEAMLSVESPSAEMGEKETVEHKKMFQISEEGNGNESGPQNPQRSMRDNDLLTLSDQERGATVEDDEDTKWNYLAGAAHRRTILTGIMGGCERLPSGDQVAVIDYEGIRVAIPVREMVLADWPEDEPAPVNVRAKMGRMLGATVDFIPVAVDMRARAAIGSRKAAMLDRQKHYYGSGRIQPGIRVACRVVGIAGNRLIVEAFGAESVINTKEVSYDWYADVADLYSVGDLVVARVLSVNMDEGTGLYSVRLSIKQAQSNASMDNLKKITPKSNYFGTVTTVRDGVIFVRLQAGVNAKTKIYRTKVIPSMFDTVSFHVNRIDAESGVAMGYITRIIKRHARLR